MRILQVRNQLATEGINFIVADAQLARDRQPRGRFASPRPGVVGCLDINDANDTTA